MKKLAAIPIIATLILSVGMLHAKRSRPAPEYGDMIWGPVSGAVTENSITVSYRLKQPEMACRLCISPNENLSGKTFTKMMPTAAEHGNTLKFVATGLKPDTTYYYALEIDGELADKTTGKCRTFPTSFDTLTFAFGNSIKHSGQKTGVLASADHDIAFFLCTGDLFYNDIKENDIELFRKAYLSSFMREDLSILCRKAPLVYMWDDHDFGPNNSTKHSPSRQASIKAYREIIPHYPLPASEDEPIYQAFSVANVRFVVTDLRSQRDAPSMADMEAKSMMGEQQLTWFLEELKESAKSHDMIFWVSSVPYTAPVSPREDHWGGFQTERTKIANFIKANELSNLMIISGDAHCVAATDGRDNAGYADGGGTPIAEIIAAPLDNNKRSRKGGPWSQGTYAAPIGKYAYGLVTLTQDKESITVNFSGRDSDHNDHVTLSKRYARR